MLELLKSKKPKVEATPSQLDFLNRVYLRCGGNWRSLTEGDPLETSKLERVLKAGIKLGILTRSSWE